MPDWILYVIIFVIFSPFLLVLSNAVEYSIWSWKETHGRGLKCECRLPNSYSPLGSTFVCDDCAMKWYSSHDNVCWAGWARAPWQWRLFMRMGLDKKRRKQPDPPPLPEPQIATAAGRLARLQNKVKYRLSR